MKIPTKKAVATLALGLGLAAAGAKTVAASSAPVNVGKIVPVNLVADNSTTSGYVVSPSLRLGDCDAYSCSCLCGVRG